MHYLKMCWLCAMVILYLTNLTLGDEPKIVIIGAGPAGIAAASKLYENGFLNVTILEAQDRIGGRVYTTWFDESWIDLGAQWVHGETNNIVFELASSLGLLKVPSVMDYYGTPFIIHNSEGSLVPDFISNELLQIFFTVEGKAQDQWKRNYSSVGEYFTQMITFEATKYPAINQSLMEQFMHFFERYLNVLSASDSWYDTSAREFKEHWRCPGNSAVNWKDKGYATILDVLMKKYPNPENELPVLNNTLLNSEVVNINYNPTKNNVLVKLTDGKEHIADHVIVTPSLGVLKEQYRTLFTPQLPELKIKAIKGLSMGTVAKLYYFFEKAWWPSSAGSFGLVWTEKDRQEYENDPDRKWLLDLNAFFTIAERPRILCGWINGAGSRHMETLPEDQVLNETLAILHKFVGKSYNITRPTGFLRSNWYSNKHFRGTYSFRSMETEKAGVWADDLAAPILVNDNPIVMFAGEATHPHYYSTVHGAIESGFREANRLAAMYNKSIQV